jgi:CRISPR-associated protein Cas2
MQAYLACFDVSDDRVRYRVGKYLGEFGVRVQKSVFEIAVEKPDELELLRRELRPMLESGDDLRFYALCRSCRQKSHDVDGLRVAEFPAALIV